MSKKSIVVGLESLKQFSVVEEAPGYWRATFNNPPVNLYDPSTFLELRSLWEKIDETKDVNVLVFDSANPDYFISHYDLVRATEVPEKHGDDHVYGWAKLFTRFNESPVVTMASIRGATRGIGSEFALACDMRFASKEKARFCADRGRFRLHPRRRRDRLAVRECWTRSRDRDHVRRRRLRRHNGRRLRLDQPCVPRCGSGRLRG